MSKAKPAGLHLLAVTSALFSALAGPPEASLRGVSYNSRRLQEAPLDSGAEDSTGNASAGVGVPLVGPSSADALRVTSCAIEGCGGPYKPQNSCQCTDDCSKYGNCCSDYDTLCRETSKCAYFGCGGEYKHENPCQCTDECSKYGNCCSDYDTVCRETSKCAYFGCGGEYRRENPCQCTDECSKYGNCCSDYDIVCRNDPRAKCDYYGCNGGYRPSNSCQCNCECEKYNNCCDDWWSICNPRDNCDPELLVTYESYHGRLARHPHGAKDIDTNSSAPVGLSVEQCEDRCTQDEQCSCVTFAPQTGKCWKRAHCVKSDWLYANDYDVYLKKVEGCLPEHAECGGAWGPHGQCCAGSTCQGVMGSGKMYCVQSSTAAETELAAEASRGGSAYVAEANATSTQPVLFP